ncbi:LOX5 lipoxygenase, partial [Atractosteus spatula]|nr:LOX5 lipoxygenase [Atractosteus spatula]
MTGYIIKVEADPSSDKIWVILSNGNIKSQETAIAKEGDTVIDFEKKPEEILIRRETSLLRTFSTGYCRYVTATRADNTYYFPVFRNISAGLTTIKENSGKLPLQDDSEERKKDMEEKMEFLQTVGWNQMSKTVDELKVKLGAFFGKALSEKKKSFLLKALSFILKLIHAFREETLCIESVDGLPCYAKADSIFKLPRELWFDASKLLTLVYNTAVVKMQKIISRVWNFGRKWRKLEHIQRVFLYPSKKAVLHLLNVEYVSKNWKEDVFFSSQFLNGCNPVLIKKYTQQKIPAEKLEVFDCFFSLSQAGIIYVVDYELLDGIKENFHSGHQQFLAAPIVLLKEEDKNLMPIAIQLRQKPADDEPIFTPNDGNAWLLAKIWVRNADFYVHELSSHLLRTHLMGEAFFIAVHGCLSRRHPILRLLFESGRYTLPINVSARNTLVNKDGFFMKYTGIGEDAQWVILKKAYKQLTYESLCLPDDLKNRGVENLSNYYYKQDGLRIWEAIHKFVQAVLNNYYKDDTAIKDDLELKTFVDKLYQTGTGKKEGWPNSLQTKEETAKFLTMIMFTCSAQHAAVNNGQYDSYAWMPNGPTTMRQPPPKLKEDVTEEYIMNTLPDINVTLESMSVARFLSQTSPDTKLLGEYSDKVKYEPKMKGPIEEFNEDLKKIKEYIDERSKTQEFPYEYLHPALLENSITI